MDKHNPISNEHIVANWVVVAQEEKEGVKEDPTIRGGQPHQQRAYRCQRGKMLIVYLH